MTLISIFAHLADNSKGDAELRGIDPRLNNVASLQQPALLFMPGGHADMRKGFDPLSGMDTSMMEYNPISGDIYIFFNRRRNQVKLLHLCN